MVFLKHSPPVTNIAPPCDSKIAVDHIAILISCVALVSVCLRRYVRQNKSNVKFGDSFVNMKLILLTLPSEFHADWMLLLPP